MKKMFFVAVIFLIVSSLFVVACEAPTPTESGSSDEAAPTTLKIGHSIWVGYGPLYIARDKGYFAEEGVEVELVVVDDVKSRFAALAAGELDGLATTLDTMPLYYNPENQFSSVVLLDDSQGGDGVVANADVTSIAELAGKKVAFLEGSTSHFYITYLLQEAGLSLDDIEAVSMSPGDAGAAFVSQNVEAAVTWEPWLTNGKKADHGQVLVDTSETPGLIVDVLLFSDGVIDGQAEAVQGVVNAYYKAVDFYESNPDEAVEIMAAGVGGWLEDPAEFATTLEGVQLLGQTDNEALFDSTAKETVEFAINFWQEEGSLTSEMTADDLLNNAFQ